LRNVIPIGRARAGIYILIKQTIARDRVEIVMSPYTIPDVVNMVIFAGGVPVFVDFLPGSTNVAVDAVDRAMSPRTAAVLLTHYHVNQEHLAEIGQLCRAKSVPLFDDCAIAFGADYDGAPIGGLTDASVMSFSSYKLLNYFWGGALAVRSGPLFQTVAPIQEAGRQNADLRGRHQPGRLSGVFSPAPPPRRQSKNRRCLPALPG
jgi:dTDP-4-amino-4,6-dideoxygalactose transaminase